MSFSLHSFPLQSDRLYYVGVGNGVMFLPNIGQGAVSMDSDGIIYVRNNNDTAVYTINTEPVSVNLNLPRPIRINLTASPTRTMNGRRIWSANLQLTCDNVPNVSFSRTIYYANGVHFVRVRSPLGLFARVIFIGAQIDRFTVVQNNIHSNGRTYYIRRVEFNGDVIVHLGD